MALVRTSVSKWPGISFTWTHSLLQTCGHVGHHMMWLTSQNIVRTLKSSTLQFAQVIGLVGWQKLVKIFFFFSLFGDPPFALRRSLSCGSAITERQLSPANFAVGNGAASTARLR